MRQRLRDHGPPEYNVVRDNFVWRDHVLRVMVTAGAIAWCEPQMVVDPACGDATIVSYANRLRPIERAYLNDISAPQIADLWGKDLGFKADLGCGDAAEFLAGAKADVVVLTEILEHVEDPDRLVRLARKAGRFLVASSPIGETAEMNNHEHLWAWDLEGYEDMLRGAGWRTIGLNEITRVGMYSFQVWICR